MLFIFWLENHFTSENLQIQGCPKLGIIIQYSVYYKLIIQLQQ